MKFFTLILFLATGVKVFAAQLVLDTCDDSHYVTRVGASEQLTVSNVERSAEKGKAVEVRYSHEFGPAWTKNVVLTRTFPTPVDLRDFERLSYDVQVPRSQPGIILVLHLVDDKDHEMRLVDYGALSARAPEWQTRSFPLSDFQKSRWVAHGRAVNLCKIRKIAYHIQNQQPLAESGELVFRLDNVTVTLNRPALFETLLEGFETYPNDAPLVGRWTPRNTFTSCFLDTTQPYQGTRAMQLRTSLPGRWINAWATFSWDAPRDFSDARYLRVAVFGDAKLQKYEPTVHLSLTDVAGNRAMATIWKWPAEPEWADMFLPFTADGIEGFSEDKASAREFGGNSCWREDYYDQRPWNEKTDLSRIISMQLNIEAQINGVYPIEDVRIGFDHLVVGYARDPATAAARSLGSVPAGSTANPRSGAASPSAVAAVAWQSPESGALETAGRARKPILLYFRRAGFKLCEDFEQTCLLTDEFQRRAARFVCVFEDTTYSQILIYRYNVFRVPDVLIINGRGEVAARHTFDISPEALYASMEQIR
jgi:hypothetical protein